MRERCLEVGSRERREEGGGSRERERERERERDLLPTTDAPESAAATGVSVDITPDTRTLDLSHGNFTVLPEGYSIRYVPL